MLRKNFRDVLGVLDYLLEVDSVDYCLVSVLRVLSGMCSKYV